MNFIIIIIIVALAIIFINAIVNFPNGNCCDFDCSKCPFPECSPKEKEWKRKIAEKYKEESDK